MEQYDPTMTEAEVARTYRESYIAGNQAVTFESIMTILNEQSFFVRTSQIKGRHESPSVNALNDIALPDDFTEEQLALISDEKIRETQISAFVYDHWRNNEANFTAIRRLIENSGQESILAQFNSLESYIKNKGQIDSAKVRGCSMLQIYRRLMAMVMRFRIMFLEVQQDDFSCFTSNQTCNITDVITELKLATKFFDLDKELIINVTRHP